MAGRALNKFWEMTAPIGVRRVVKAKTPAMPAILVRRADRHVVVKSLVKPEFDVNNLARVYVRLAQQKIKERQQENQTEDDAA